MRERTITLSSLGKTFSLTGWKIGWACTPAPLTRAVRSAHQFVTFATATPFQHAAVAALSAPESYYQDFVAQFREKRDFLASVLEQVGFTVMRPQGTYFICAGIEKIGKGLKDIEFSRMLTQAGVAVIPPSVFYERSLEGEGYVRFAFCKRRETLEQAAEKLVAWRNGCG
jgi:N-succinyldiaminopimelate aminotransferase